MKPDRIKGGAGIDISLAYALRFLTLYENTSKDAAAEKELMRSKFQKQVDDVFGKEGDPYNPHFGDSRAAFVEFAKDYAAVLREHNMAEERLRQEQRLAEADKIRREKEEERKQQEALRLEKEAIDAKLASVAEAEKIRLAAENEALRKLAEEKQQKLQAILSSQEYQIWEQSLRIKQALQMIEEAQKAMNYETAVQAESSVADLGALRSAGEKMVAGKSLLKHAFAAYKELGGTAASAEEVEVGPDPAEPYR